MVSRSFQDPQQPKHVGKTVANRNKICGAPGCAKLSEHGAGKVSRQINDVELCRGCYQRIWELEQKTGKRKEDLFREGVKPAQRALPRIATTCSRDGCGAELPLNAGSNIRSTIGLQHVCRLCYQQAWYYSKRGSISIENAFQQMKPKNWRPDPPKTVRCCLPWCDEQAIPDETTTVSTNVHACGLCRTYLKVLGHRPLYKGIDWKELAANAIKGTVTAPGSPKLCALPWCNNVEVSRSRGPNGEPICNSDKTYLYQYAKRNGITVHEAFQTAPPPRLLHTRNKDK